MYKTEQQVLQNAGKSNKYHKILNRTLQFLAPVALLSFFLSYTSSSPFVFNFHFHISTLVFPLNAHILERKYMLLICNGILTFLSKNLIFRSSTHDGDYVRSNTDDVKPTSESLKIIEEPALEDNEGAIESSIASLDNVAISEEVENRSLDTQANEKDRPALIRESEDIKEYEDDEVEEGGILIGVLAKDEGKEENVDIHELNKKFEEFIKKIKEEICTEAQQLTIVQDTT